MNELTPKQIVRELNYFVVGQRDAKRAVAIALRNRWRSQQLPEDIRDEVAPKNILMIGPTGVGKTEISRRLSKLAEAPFIKVEATKFTEVGYVGKDVEQIIRDLIEISIALIKEKKRKEVLAKVLHDASSRYSRPFISINCGAIPENLMEDLLFGHEKGAFTGAIKEHRGVFEQADTGTLFLDEIGELPPNLQTKLLRVLQERNVTRLGSNNQTKVDFRLIAATNKNLKKAIEIKIF